MAIQLDNDIWFIIIGILQARAIHGNSFDRQSAKAALLTLRLTNRFLAVATAAHLLWLIRIHKFDTASYQRLQNLLRSPTSCQVVKRYELTPQIITCRQGELNSPYHKVPPHLDYGRQTNSPQIQKENKQLKAAAAHWGQQYRIIFPTQNKAAATLKDVFKWSSTSSKPSLKDSVYLNALEAFANLRHLIVQYPHPKSEKINRIVSNEYSVALGRYLAKSPQNLVVLELKYLAPNNLETLAQSLSDTSKGSSQDIALNISNLSLLLDNAFESPEESLHIFQGAGPALEILLHCMPRLQKLAIDYGIDDRTRAKNNFPNLLLSPFKSPPLPKLTNLMLHWLAFSPEDLTALVLSSPSRLTELELRSISLTGPSWAQLFRSFATNETLEYFLQPLNVTRVTYHDLPTGKSKRQVTEEDRRAQLEWQAKVQERVSRSMDDQRSDFSDI